MNVENNVLLKSIKRGVKNMSLSISKLVLLDLLQKAYPIIPLKSSLQILSNFRISFQKGRLEITATDLDQSIKIFSP